MLKKKLQRMLSLMIAGALAAGCLTACGGNAEETKTSQAESQTTENVAKESEEPAEPDKLTYWVEFSSEELKSLGEMEMMQEMEERANVEIEFYHPSGSAGEQFNLKVASNMTKSLQRKK